GPPPVARGCSAGAHRAPQDRQHGRPGGVVRCARGAGRARRLLPRWVATPTQGERAAAARGARGRLRPRRPDTLAGAGGRDAEQHSAADVRQRRAVRQGGGPRGAPHRDGPRGPGRARRRRGPSVRDPAPLPVAGAGEGGVHRVLRGLAARRAVRRPPGGAGRVARPRHPGADRALGAPRRSGAVHPRRRRRGGPPAPPRRLRAAARPPRGTARGRAGPLEPEPRPGGGRGAARDERGAPHPGGQRGGLQAARPGGGPDDGPQCGPGAGAAPAGAPGVGRERRTCPEPGAGRRPAGDRRARRRQPRQPAARSCHGRRPGPVDVGLRRLGRLTRGGAAPRAGRRRSRSLTCL
ncbi:MAG: hypothetical protein AVDCRST_MAG36-1279, partial [uncultured Nocardioidaceae bacterium]